MMRSRAVGAVGWGGLFALGLALTCPSSARATPAEEREQCASSAERFQQLRDEGKYRRAREQALVCARDVCPNAIKTDCGKWLADIDRDAPTVVFGARDGGKDVADVRVSMDGTVVAERLDGKPILVDTGEHTFKFERAGVVREEKVLVRAAEKARLLTVTFAPEQVTPPPKIVKEPVPQPPSEKERESGSLVPAAIAGGIGVVALGSFAFFGIQGKSDVDDLQSCKPNCLESDVDSARTKLRIADVSLGLGVVALGVATYLFLTRPKVDAKVQASSIRLGPWELAPTRNGGAVGLGGAF